MPSSRKKCHSCKKKKPYSDFHKNSSCKDGFHTKCKKCRLSYYKSVWKSLGLPRQRRFRKTEVGRRSHLEANSKYSRTEKGKQTAKRTYLKRKIKPDFLLKKRARRKIAYLKEKGRLIYPKDCFICGEEGEVEAHHYLGYEKEHWLDIIFLCKNCHLLYDTNPILSSQPLTGPAS